MKVVWLCKFSNPIVRGRLNLRVSLLEKIIRKFFNIPQRKFSDIALWITNLLNSLENNNELNLFVISPHDGLKNQIEEFSISGINYIFFKCESDSLFKRIIYFIFGKFEKEFIRNRKTIQNLIRTIDPDVIHLFGAENFFYSISALDIDKQRYPLLVTLQTLLNDDKFIENYPFPQKIYKFASEIEMKILQRTNYLSSSVVDYRKIVWNKINPKAIFFNSFLGIEQKIPRYDLPKKYDFVYFANSIDKAADIAVEAFALVIQKYPGLMLNIIGKMPKNFTTSLKNRIRELGIEENVIFSGHFEEHSEVMKQIQYSKFALIPLKYDHTSGTIREAMFAGLPVVTTITIGTPSLNENRESVLISEQGDLIGLANNMIKLIENPDLAEKLSTNALITAKEKWNNDAIVNEMLEAYKFIINHHNGKEIYTSFSNFEYKNLN